MPQHEPHHILTLNQRIADFRDAGLIQNLPDDFSHADVLDSYLSDGSNNADFARLYGRISELMSQIIEDTEFLEHLDDKDAHNLLELMHSLRNDINMTLEGAIDEVSRFATTTTDLAEYIANITSSQIEEHAQTLIQATEMIRLFSSNGEPETDILHSKLNSSLINKLNRIMYRLTQISELALLLEHIIRDPNS
jgi:hypothetical protein